MRRSTRSWQPTSGRPRRWRSCRRAGHPEHRCQPPRGCSVGQARIGKPPGLQPAARRLPRSFAPPPRARSPRRRGRTAPRRLGVRPASSRSRARRTCSTTSGAASTTWRGPSRRGRLMMVPTQPAPSTASGTGGRRPRPRARGGGHPPNRGPLPGPDRRPWREGLLFRCLRSSRQMASRLWLAPSVRRPGGWMSWPSQSASP
mmetsp:Transcript_20515/g.66400  ORF Transcript_20515/g.66400 Transcript_20515/m.66400 type:complete len:202 (-) Transcript_20515:161-766(-)